jgi:2-polyprenyl-6-methoxyphenol hydroxylase-like FAD-dependent oxidoreductase
MTLALELGGNVLHHALIEPSDRGIYPVGLGDVLSAQVRRLYGHMGSFDTLARELERPPSPLGTPGTPAPVRSA